MCVYWFYGKNNNVKFGVDFVLIKCVINIVSLLFSDMFLLNISFSL